MAWVAVDKIGEELISRTEPFRIGEYWIGYSIFHLPKGSIKKLTSNEFIEKKIKDILGDDVADGKTKNSYARQNI